LALGHAVWVDTVNQRVAIIIDSIETIQLDARISCALFWRKITAVLTATLSK